MDSQEAIDYLKKMHEGEASQTSNDAPTEGPAATGTQTAEPKKPEPETEPAGDREPPKDAAPENKPQEPAPKPQEPQPQKKPSKQERINHAFQREKQRHKAELEAKDKRIAELEEKIKRYGVLEQKDFDPNDMKSYIDHKFALQGEQAELEKLKADRDRMVADDRTREATERHERQVSECFATDEERDRYWTLLKNGGSKFREFLNEYDDGTIDSFIGDSDIAPVMIATLMRNPDVLRSIVEKQNPTRKMFALQQLENRLHLQRRLSQVNTQTPQPSGAAPTQTPAPAPKLPITGSQVVNPGSAGEVRTRDWNRYLTEHPRGT